MTNIRFLKIIAFFVAIYFIGVTVQARPEYLKIFASDPYSRPELRANCTVCHINPEGGGERNEFGKAFAQAGLRITPQLRKQFPDRFLPETGGQSDQPPVTFVEGSESEAIVELNGKRFMINTRDKTVREMETAPPQEKSIADAKVKAQPAPELPHVYRPVDVRLINLPTAMPIPKGSLWTDFTHRFPFGEPTDAAGLFGLDSFAIPSFGFIYGITDRIHVGAYRSPGNVGRPIQLHAGASFLNEQEGDPFSLMGRVGIEGRDNFQRNFTTSLEFNFARSITRHAQIYFVPTASLGDRLLSGDPTRNLPGENAFALGLGLSVNIRPSVALMAEANYRLNKVARYLEIGNGIRRPVFGFGIQKASASRRHAFSLVFTNGPGTTMSQRSMTRGLFFADDGFEGLTIGFNLSRRLF
jgi:hypothetical protein